MATAKKAKTATKGKASGRSAKATKATKVVKKKVAPKVAAKGKAAAKAKAKAKPALKQVKKVVKAKPAPKTAVKARAKAKPAAKTVKKTKTPAKATKAKVSAKVKTKATAKVAAKVTAKVAAKATAKVAKKSNAKVVPTKPTKAPPKVIPKTKTVTAKSPPPKAPAVKATSKSTPIKQVPATKLPAKSTKAPVSVPAALERPKTPVGKQLGRATIIAAAPAPPLAVTPVPTRALPKSMTVKAVKSNVLPFNPKTTGVAGYLSEAEILKQPKDKYMSKEQLAFFKQRLLELQSQLRENAGQTTEHLRELSIVPDPADRATLEEEHALELRARDRERKLLKKVEAAILRISEGDYGYCEETGEPIGVPRLLARPTATLTIEAQERRELKQRMFGE